MHYYSGCTTCVVSRSLQQRHLWLLSTLKLCHECDSIFVVLLSVHWQLANQL